MTRFHEKSLVVEAMQWGGRNTNEVVHWALEGWKDSGMWLKQKITPDGKDTGLVLVVPTNTGDYDAKAGDWIIRRANGTLSCCDTATFAATYEPTDG